MMDIVIRFDCFIQPWTGRGKVTFFEVDQVLGNSKKAIGFFERASKANYLDSESILKSLLAADTR